MLFTTANLFENKTNAKQYYRKFVEKAKKEKKKVEKNAQCQYILFRIVVD